MSGAQSERFWDERARENAIHYVDNRTDDQSTVPESFWRGGEEALERMLADTGLTIGPDDVVVDIGCGVGRTTRALAARARRVYGIDVSSEMLSRAAEHNGHLDNVDWLHGDGETLRVVGDASADGIFSHVVFQHLPRPDMTLGYVREMGRVLKAGGWALFQVSTDPDVHRAPVLQRLKSLVSRGADPEADPAWLGSAVTLPELRDAAAAGGLRLDAVVGEGTQYTTVLARRG